MAIEEFKKIPRAKLTKLLMNDQDKNGLTVLDYYLNNHISETSIRDTIDALNIQVKKMNDDTVGKENAEAINKRLLENGNLKFVKYNNKAASLKKKMQVLAATLALKDSFR